MLQIIGTITTTTPVFQTAPDSQKGGLSATIKTRVWDDGKKIRTIPYVTAGSLRGLIRRAAAKRVLDTLNRDVPRELFQILNGGSKGRGSIGEQASMEVLSKGSRQAFAGLFGGGPYMFHSSYSVDHLIPLVEWCSRRFHWSLRDRSMIPAANLSYEERDEEGRVVGMRDVSLTTTVTMAPRDDLLAGKGEGYITNYFESLSEYLKSIGEGRANKAAEKKAKADAKERGEKFVASKGALSKDVANLVQIEAMLPGTPLQFWARLKPQATPAQVGLLLLAIQDWANANQLGGGTARGFGRFEADLALWEDDREIVPNLFRASDHVTSYLLNDALGEYVSAAERELAAMTLDDLEMVYPSKTEPVKDAA